MGKRILPYILAIVAFIIVGYAYAPYTLSGKVVNQSDISSWKGMSREIVEWNEAHPDDPTYWTNSMFSGMPATTISVIYHGDITKYLYDVLFVGQRPASYLIICMIGAFLMFLAFGVNVWLAILGAIAVAFCSYNMQIIQVGHNTKMVAIAFMPWVIASLVYAYRKNWLLGAALFGLALSFQIKANHPQITYYLAIIVLGFAIWQFCKAVKEKALGRFFKVSVAVLVAGLLGIAANTNHLWPTYEYGQHTMRGGSELSTGADNGADKAQNGKKTRSGLDLEYATQWSYGIEETPNLFIPDFNGGASSGALDSSSSVYKTLTQQYNYPPLQAEQAVQNLPLYWGPQAFTAGPMYMGIITVFVICSASSRGCTSRRISRLWMAPEANPTVNRNILEYLCCPVLAAPMALPMIPWITDAATHAVVLALEGKTRRRCRAAIPAVSAPETGPPRRPADRIPITLALGIAPVTCMPI